MKNGSGRRAPAAAEKPSSDKVIRCAIHTRESTEEGLQQDFSSLDAQREAGEAFVASQRTEGWQLVPERTRDKMCAARKKGKWIGGHPVLGYDIDTKARRLVVNPAEAHQVRTIFDQYLEHGAMLPVLQDLDLRGWRTKQWTAEASQTRGGKPFTKSLLYGVLTNAIYTGQVKHKGTLFPGEHEAIIERATWERTQDMLDRNGRTNGGGAKNKYGALLRGLLFCVTCGTAMVHTYSVKGNKRYRYYVCYTAQQRGWKNCRTKSVAAQAVENAVLEAIRRLGSDQQLAAEVVRQAREQLARRREDHDKDVAVAEAALRRLNAEVTAIAGDAVINATARVDRLLDLQGQIQVAEHRLANLMTEGRELEADQFDDAPAVRALAEFDPVWASLATREQTRLVQLLVARVGLDGRNDKVTVDFRSTGIRELCNGTTTKA